MSRAQRRGFVASKISILLATKSAHTGFAVFWADGNPNILTRSCLYFSNADGTRVFRLPYDMPEDFAKPEPVRAP